MWRSIDMRDVCEFCYLEPAFVCRKAVNLSSGELVEVKVGGFVTDELLHYIVDRAPNLRSLRLDLCKCISEEGLAEVAKKLQHLEELHLYCTSFPIKALENVGHYCPQLKSLILNTRVSSVPHMEDFADWEALVIAHTMPGLRHLSLFGNQMRNDGLQAILIGCPDLESLDIRRCFSVDLEVALVRTCAQQIKNLKWPNDPIFANEFGADLYRELGCSSSDDMECDESGLGDDCVFFDDSVMSDDHDNDWQFDLPRMAFRPSSSLSPNWLELPEEVTTSILHRLGAIAILNVAQNVCATWRRICKDPVMWRSIDMLSLGDYVDDPAYLVTMCQRAVDRSCGQLTEIKLGYFVTDELLDGIAYRASNLRSLQLNLCECISYKVLAEVSKKLPNLEELHFYLTPVPIKALENFGHYCPQLISLTYNSLCSKDTRKEYDEYALHGHDEEDEVEDNNEEALAIARTMHRLRHLSLIGNKMTNVGLKAILNLCHQLESLDIRRCFSVGLDWASVRMCAQRIKNLKCPGDLIDYNEEYWSCYDEYMSYYNGYGSFYDEYGSYYDEYGSSDDEYGYSDDESGLYCGLYDVEECKLCKSYDHVTELCDIGFSDDDYVYSSGSAISDDFNYDRQFDFRRPVWWKGLVLPSRHINFFGCSLSAFLFKSYAVFS